ncbi:hypothetical protein FJY93_00045 [Candidatus Kaiserbacteria bacterium]|nr:hypothetical protein [Candidatus Kaiserbacteria bacterium]
MPPQKSQGTIPINNPDHLLPEHTKSSGPLFGTAIIIALLLIGAFYFWGAELNRRNATDQLPLIPAGDVTVQ